jgi:hypothetical protein
VEVSGGDAGREGCADASHRHRAIPNAVNSIAISAVDLRLG